MRSYYKLTSQQHNGLVVRVNEDRTENYYDSSEKQWKPVAIMIHYFWPESDTFELYEELTTKELKKLNIPE